MSGSILASLNVLRVFEAAARLGSFKDAGEELHVTASAVSQPVKALEAQLGVSLFERQPRGLSLTDAGRQYAEEIRPHLAAIEDATRKLCDGGREALRVSLMPPLASHVVFPRLAEFREQHPTLDLHIDTRIDAVDLRQRKVDLAVRFGVPPWAGCVHVKLTDVYLQALCPPRLAHEHQLRSRPENLSLLPLVHMTGRPEAWRRFFEHLGLDMPKGTACHVDDYPAAIEAATTIGATLGALPLERPLIDEGRVVPVGPVLGPLEEAVYAVWLEERSDHRATWVFVEWLREQLSDLGGVVS